MTRRKDAIADNAVVDEALFETDVAMGSLEMPPYMGHRIWDSVGYDDDPERGIGVGVARVHASRKRSVALSVDLEDGDSGFEVGAWLELDHEQALALAEAIVKTAEARKD